jgi:hypothetical protein
LIITAGRQSKKLKNALDIGNEGEKKDQLVYGLLFMVYGWAGVRINLDFLRTPNSKL